MRLLVVSHACAAAVNQQLYAAVQREAGWEVALVIPSNWVDEYGRASEAVEKVNGFGGEIIPVAVRRPGEIILHTYRTSFTKLIRRVDPDVIYMHHEPYAAATAQVLWGNARSGRRRPIGFYSAQNIMKRYPPPFRWTERWALRSAEFAFPCSSSVSKVLKQKAFRGLCEVLPLPIDPTVHHPHPEDARARCELTGCDAEANDKKKVLLGYLGRFVPEKGLITLLDALAMLPDTNWHLALIGDGTMTSELRRRAASAGLSSRITFSGFVPHAQVGRLLSAMDVLVLPSETQPNWREQFGRVILEAMACGTCVVGTDSGEIPTLIRDTGGGIIAQERNPTDLAVALRQVIGDAALRSRLANAGYAAVTARYSVAGAARRFVETIERILNSKAPVLATA